MIDASSSTPGTEHSCSKCQLDLSSTQQTLSELEWTRGIWFSALTGDRDDVFRKIRSSRHPELLVQAKDNSDYTALHYAARSGHTDICRLLVQYGACINAPTKSTRATPLHRAASSGHVDTVNFLVTSGAQVDIQDIDGQTALHKAAQFQRHPVIMALLAEKPMLEHVKDNNGRTASDFLTNNGTIL